ncbi:hypothetical protein G6553_15290 [Nocardioides sp. IC4_145]|uniref:hypothetical protein n=1 Tax=Nocardioides sp. IC4_145 TaxID=2714037 RepID=UPI00140CFD45|nr:hypothetical protein [Nocardioides sp. IC4_145]NHC24533.1 hypothetical protein [Nocardioides sp. IC4_145]
MIESWVVGLVCNTVIMVAYLLISVAIIVPLWRSHQLRSNPLGAATAAIFLSCAVHHGAHSVHMLMPTFGVDVAAGYAMRTAWGWPLAISDIVGALVGLWYWSLRRTYSSLMQGAQLFEDLRRREQQALELNDTVLQGMVVAKMALDLDDPVKAHAALGTSIDSASRIITSLLGSQHFDVDMTRSAPADVGAPTPAPGPAAVPAPATERPAP